MQRRIDPSRSEGGKTRRQRLDGKRLSLRRKKLESEAGKRIFSEWQGRLNASFMEAANEGRTKRVERLLKVGADINANDRWRETALMHAVCSGHIETCKLLLEYGADLEATDVSSYTALMLAAGWGRTKICELLLENGADITKRTSQENNAFAIAKSFGKCETAGFLAFAEYAPMIFADKRMSDSFYYAFRGCVS
jgi:hypothetical protein